MILVVIQFFKSGSLSDNRGGLIFLIEPEVILTPDLHLDRLLPSPSFNPTSLLCSTTVCNQILFGLFYHCFLTDSLWSVLPLFVARLSLVCSTTVCCQILFGLFYHCL